MSFPFVYSRSIVENAKRIVRDIFLTEEDSSPSLGQLLKRIPAPRGLAQASPQRGPGSNDDHDTIPDPEGLDPAILDKIFKQKDKSRPDAAKLGWGTRNDLAQMAFRAQPGGRRPDRVSDIPLIKVDPIAAQEDPASGKQLRHMELKRLEGDLHPRSHFTPFSVGGEAVHSEHGYDPERHEKEFWDSFHHPEKGRLVSVRRNSSEGICPSFLGTTQDGKRVIIKPNFRQGDPALPGGKFPHPERGSESRGARHHAMRRLAAHMGHGHLLTPGNLVDLTHDKFIDPDKAKALGIDTKDMEVLKQYAGPGRKAFVSELAPGKFTPWWHVSAPDADNVDPRDIKAGAELHALMNQQDGHGHNFGLSGNGRLLLIDNDRTLNWNSYGRGGWSSELISGAASYRNHIRKMAQYQSGKIGKNYQPKFAKMLNWINQNGHVHPRHGLGLDDRNSDMLKEIADSMLSNGFETHLGY